MSYESDLNTAIDAWKVTAARWNGLSYPSPERGSHYQAREAERTARGQIVRQAAESFVSDGGSLDVRFHPTFAELAVAEFRRISKDFTARQLLDVMKAVTQPEGITRRQEFWTENIRRLVAAA